MPDRDGLSVLSGTALAYLTKLKTPIAWVGLAVAAGVIRPLGTVGLAPDDIPVGVVFHDKQVSSSFVVAPTTITFRIHNKKKSQLES